MRVINFFGGPGSGKSTIASGLFHLMKTKHFEVELVTEYAKELVWSERHTMFAEQDYVFAKQNHRLKRLIGKVDWAITDSPLVLGHFYMCDTFPGKDHFCQFVNETFESYDNINILLKRCNKYNSNGRNQSEQEAIQIDHQIIQFLELNNINYYTIESTDFAHQKAYEHIFSGSYERK